MAIKLDDLAGPDGGKKSLRLAKYWLDQINSVIDNSEYKRWHKRGETIVKRYRDERNRTDEEGQRRYNSLWSNVEILKPALYGRCPIPIAERRFKDKDPTGRGAAQILERALRNEIEVCGYDESMQQAVTDYLLPGRGIVWVRYEPEISESISLPIDPQTDIKDDQGSLGRDEPESIQDITGKGRSRPRLNESERGDEETPEEEPETETDEVEPEGESEQEEESEKLEDTGDRVIRESTPVDFIPWEDFFTFPVRARTWREVTAIAKRVYMSRDQMVKRFGKQIGKAIPLEKDNRGDRTQNTTLQAAEQDKGRVFEIWSKEDQSVYWVALGYDHLCDYKDDPLKLENFWPVPRPLYSNATNNTLFPVPDYIQYQDQAIQIDELTQRIAMLTKACKMAGVYNAAAKDIQRLFQESVENQLIPVDDWAAFAEEGGVAGNMALLPVKDIIGIINELIMAKQKQIEEMDRLTGINDIMRGTSDARETLGGVRLKSNSTGTRLSWRQNEVARFARDTVRIMADIMCQHFSPQSLIEVSGALYEEGLGPDDMPELNALQQPPAPPPQQPGPLAAPSPPAVPPPNPQPTAGNIVPFARPGGQPQPGGPPSPPMAPAAPQQPPQVPQVPPEVLNSLKAIERISKAIQLLRNERLRGFRVDLEVDSTIFPDAAQEKQDRNEFIASVTQFLQQAMMMGASMPESVPLLGKLLQFGVRGYKVGRDLESAIEEFTDEAAVKIRDRMLNQSQNNPEQQKAQIDLQKAQLQNQAVVARTKADVMKSQAEIQATQLDSQAQERSAQAEIARQALENKGEQANSQADIATKQMDVQMRQMEMEIEKLRLQVELEKLQYERAHPQPVAPVKPSSGVPK